MKQRVAKAAWQHSVNRRKRGDVPTMLGVPGMLALIWESIRQFNETEDPDFILDLASNALFALEAVFPDEPEEEPEPEPEPEQQDELPEIPEEFTDWWHHPIRAVKLREWLKDQYVWADLDPVTKKEIDIVADSHEPEETEEEPS